MFRNFRKRRRRRRVCGNFVYRLRAGETRGEKRRHAEKSFHIWRVSVLWVCRRPRSSLHPRGGASERFARFESAFYGAGVGESELAAARQAESYARLKGRE